MLGRPIVFSGCGRTDAGVHASQYFGSIDLEAPFRAEQLLILNRRLPADINVFGIVPVAKNASTRFDATERRYDYFLHLDKQAGFSNKSSWYPTEHPFQVNAIRSALAQLTGVHDFRAYCKTPDRHNTTVCELRQATLFVDPTEKYLRFHFAGNRYLRGMIRLLVGNLLRVGQGKLSVATMIGHLEQKTPLPYFHLAPPDGLYLSGVDYPYLETTNQSPLHEMLVGLTQ